jgi:pimeloyl-ACP methyl ester carboxylesterase
LTYIRYVCFSGRMAHSRELGTERTVRLSSGVIDYRERGAGRPVVFVHGLLVNADLWRGVVPGIAEAGYRCIAPDWPLGSHRTPMEPTADLTPPGLADLIAEFLQALDLADVTIVANDTGGALTQILMTRHPERIGRVVLTPSDSFERFFPPVFSPLPKLAGLPGSTWLLAQATRPRALHRLPMTFGWVSKRPIPPATTDSYLRPMRTSKGVRRDLRAFLRSVHKRHTLAAAEKLPEFDRPVLLAWASEDKLFPISLAHRLAELLPGARLVEIPDSYTFIPEDRPELLTPLIVEFLTSTNAGEHRSAR